MKDATVFAYHCSRTNDDAHAVNKHRALANGGAVHNLDTGNELA